MATAEYLSGGFAPVEGERIGAGPSDVIGRLINNFSGTTANNMFNATEAQKQRDWQQYMSSTSYQRTVADMKAAGINPATLTGLNGSTGASSGGSGAAASATSGHGGLSKVVGALFKAAIAASVLG